MNPEAQHSEVELLSGDLPSVGWREWVRLPDLCRPWIKAKIDSGAKTSALHAHDIEVYSLNGVEMVHFTIHPQQRDMEKALVIETPVIDHRHVRSSAGRTTFRPVIMTTLEIMNQRVPIELTLIGRHSMKFRMLIGRQALRGRFVVDSGASYLGGRWKRRAMKWQSEQNELNGEISG